MSFILDALKKAESERSRQLGPVLMDARIALPRRAVPAWGWVLAAVLLVNVLVLGWLLLRTPATHVAPAVAADATTGTSASPPSTQATAPVAPQAQPATDVPITPPLRDNAPSLSSDAEALPTVQELLAQGVTLPELQLNLHIYDPAPAHRSVLLNGQRLREGEYTPHGVRVERITEQSVVLEAAGRRFRIVAGS